MGWRANKRTVLGATGVSLNPLICEDWISIFRNFPPKIPTTTKKKNTHWKAVPVLKEEKTRICFCFREVIIKWSEFSGHLARTDQNSTSPIRGK